MSKDDTCARLTPLGLLVLALLREGDLHPYEMMRILRMRREERLVALTNGTFYHTVARLERWGLLEEVGTDRDGNRPERTTYTLTAAGADTVAEWVRAELPRLDRPAEFRVALAEAHNLEGDEVVALLTERRLLLAAERDEYRDGLADAHARHAPEQVLVEIDRHLALTEADLAWTDRLLGRLVTGDIAWGFGALPDRTTRSAHTDPAHHLDREAAHA